MSEKLFEVEILRDLQVALLGWPAPGEAGADASLGGNGQYDDMRGQQWSDVEEIVARESGYLERLITEQICEEDLEEEMSQEADRSGEAPLRGLDTGVAGAVFALSAAGAVTAYSCNGGAFGRLHNSHHPVVTLYARERMVPLLLQCAETSGVGIENIPGGMLNIYAGRVTAMHAFAQEMLRMRTAFDSLKRRSRIGRASR